MSGFVLPADSPFYGVKFSASAAVDLMIDAAEAELASREALETAAERFARSAIGNASMVLSGVKVADIAREARLRVKRKPHLADADCVYISPAGVGFHVRTGRVLLLPDGLPEGVTAKEVQNKIAHGVKGRPIPAKAVDKIIEDSTSAAGAYRALVAYARKLVKDAADQATQDAADAARDAADAADDDAADEIDGETFDGETVEPTYDAKTDLALAWTYIMRALKSSEEWSDDMHKIANEMIAALQTVTRPMIDAA